METELLRSLAGGVELLLWFEERVPSFHDAEVLGVILDRNGATCRLKVHTFETTNKVMHDGYLELRKHVVVTFELDRVVGLSLTGFNSQNVIAGLSIERTKDGTLCIDLNPCWGLAGQIVAQDIRISLEPGTPLGSQYCR